MVTAGVFSWKPGMPDVMAMPVCQIDLCSPISRVRRQAFVEGRKQPTQKAAVAGIVHVVFMQIIVGFPGGGGEVLAGRHEYQIAIRAPQIVPRAIAVIVNNLLAVAKRAVMFRFEIHGAA